MSWCFVCALISTYSIFSAAQYSSEYGSGAGKRGGGGGAIREAGGAFGKREAAQEEQYFRKLVSNTVIDSKWKTRIL